MKFLIPVVSTLLLSFPFARGRQQTRRALQVDVHQRHLDVDDSIFNDSMVSKCGSYDYAVNLVVVEHLFFFFEATPDAQEDGCESLLVHTADGMMKEALAIPSNSLVGLDGEGQEHGSIYFGTYSLDDIIKAYEDASPYAEGHEGESYDYVYNNCGDLMGNFLKNLGHVATPLEVRMVADLLLLVAPDFVAQLRLSVMGTDKETWTDQELMIWLVEMRASSMYEEEGMITYNKASTEDIKTDTTSFTRTSTIMLVTVGFLVLVNIVMTWRLGRNMKSVDEDDIKTVVADDDNAN